MERLSLFKSLGVAFFFSACGQETVDAELHEEESTVVSGLQGWFHIPFDDVGYARTFSFFIDVDGSRAFFFDDMCDNVGAFRLRVMEQTENRIVVEPLQLLTRGDAVFSRTSESVVLTDSEDASVSFILQRGRLCGIVQPMGLSCIGGEVCDAPPL